MILIQGSMIVIWYDSDTRKYDSGIPCTMLQFPAFSPAMTSSSVPSLPGFDAATTEIMNRTVRA